MQKVTAIVTCFNQGDIIEETINSLLNQDYKALDIIIVDDGSDDENTQKRLDEYQNKRVQILKKEHGHVSAARNYGISKSKSNYIFVSDGDDTYSEKLISTLMAEINKNKEVGIASSWLKTFGLNEWIVKPDGGEIKDFLHKNNCPGQALIRKECWEQCKGYDETMKNGYEDWEFYISITKLGWKVSIVKEPLINYRIAKSSLNTAGYKKRIELLTYIVNKHIDIYTNLLIEVIIKKEQGMQEKFLQMSALYKNPSDIIDVSYGDGGMAYAINAFSELKLGVPRKD